MKALIVDDDIKNFKPNTDGADMEIKLGQSDGTYSSIFNYGARMYMYNGNLHNYGGTNSSKFTPSWSMDNGAWHNVKLWVFNPMSTTDGKKCYSFLSESKRYDQDISTISLMVYIKIRDQIIDDIHLAAGGIAETPKYLDNLCKDMIGQKLDKSISLAINNIKNYIKPISDIRGTADYRVESFRGLFRRLEKCLVDGVKTMSIMDYNNE